MMGKLLTMPTKKKKSKQADLEEVVWVEFKMPYFDSNIGKWIVRVSDEEGASMFYQYDTETEAATAHKKMFLDSVLKERATKGR